MPAVVLLVLALLALLLPSPAAAQVPLPDGSVTLAAPAWLEALQALEEANPPVEPPQAFLQVDRRLEGSFRKGVFAGVLTTRFVVPERPGETGELYLRVPVLDATTTIDEVRMDGHPTSLLPQDGMYTVGITRPGAHTVDVRFFQGKEDLRFSRKLQLALPPSGPTALSVWVPETGIEASLAEGAVTALVPADGGTRIQGHLDALGKVDLGWKREATHQASGAVKAEARLFSVLTLHEALFKGVARLDYKVREGETDRVEVVLPPDLEVLDVTGEDVLQWYPSPAADGAGGGRITVLLRYLVESGLQAEGRDDAQVRIHFQFPVDLSAPVLLRLPLPPPDVPLTGSLGLVGPAAFEVQVSSLEKARDLSLRDLPPELADLTREPMLAGFSFTEPPNLALQVTRQQELALTSTVVDDVQATTQLLEDGAEILKMRLRVRNNTRQYLAVKLPGGAVLTHALVDGVPVRPVVQGGEGGGDTLLFPLRQSERLASSQRLHVVRSGETLSDLAMQYYNDPAGWNQIWNANPALAGAMPEVGQTLVIPVAADRQEAGFFIELATRTDGHPMGRIGGRGLGLPTLDADVLAVTWHLYLPDHLAPLAFQANLTRYTDIRYDPIRRLLQYLELALVTQRAWAGSGYKSILTQRRSIYQAEASRWENNQEAVGSFPYVGRAYRFQRILAGQEPLRIRVTWVPREAFGLLHLLAFVAGLAVTLAALRRRSWRDRAWILAAAMALLVAAWFVNGVHRRLLWGLDAALAWDLARSWWPGFRDAFVRRFSRPTALLDLVTPRAVFGLLGGAVLAHVLLTFPLLLSTWALVLLVLVRRLSLRRVLPAVSALCLSIFLALPAPARAGDWDDDSERQKIAEDSFNAIMLQNETTQVNARNRKVSPARAAISDPAGMPAAAPMEMPAQAAAATTPVTPATTEGPVHGAPDGEAVVPLPRYEDVQRRLAEARESQARTPPPLVVLGASSYAGRAMTGALELDLDLGVTLSGEGLWKVVPLVGEDVVVVEARAEGGDPIPLSRQNGYHVWVTRQTGEVELKLRILVPSRGPRGSLEYDFLVARTPVTRFQCNFPGTGLEPRLRNAVRSEVSGTGGSTLLSASLEPNSRIHLVGYKDVTEEGGRQARVYTETTNLLSVGQGTVELFTVIRHNILYAGVQHFEVWIPPGLALVSADGEGAFRYTTEPAEDGGTLVLGDTAFPIRNAYEISLRMRGSLPAGETAIEARLPRSRAVEREQGWLAVEVVGNLKLEERSREGAQAVDVRQLPAEVVENAVSPILEAYRYHAPTARVLLSATLLPEREPQSGSVDHLSARTTVASEGTVLTSLTLRLRNRMRHSLTLDLPEGMTVRSALLDGQPVKPARAEDGGLVLPLKRSAGGDQPRPFELQVVLETPARALGLAGWRSLSLPSVDLPVSTVSWEVFLPRRNLYSALEGDVEPQTRAGEARWIQAPATVPVPGASTVPSPAEGTEVNAAGGALPVKVEVPTEGRRVGWTRYWLDAGDPVEVRFFYLRQWLRPFVLLATVVALACLTFLVGARWRAGHRLRAPALALPLAGVVAGIAATAWLSGPFLVALALAVGAGAFAARQGWPAGAARAVSTWLRGGYVPEGADPGVGWRSRSVGSRLGLVLVALAGGFVGLLALGRLVVVLLNPLG